MGAFGGGRPVEKGSVSHFPGPYPQFSGSTPPPLCVSSSAIWTEEDPDGVEIRIGNEDPAIGANVTPLTANRALKAWQRESVLTGVAARIFCKDPSPSRIDKPSIINNLGGHCPGAIGSLLQCSDVLRASCEHRYINQH